MDFRILGPLEVHEDGRPLALGGMKQRALLALLLLHANRVVPRDRLIDELWETDPPETARTALQVHVSQLRKALGRERIVTDSPGYLVRVEPGELDAEQFEQLVASGDADAALALWRGPALAGLDASFAAAERARLDELRLLVVEQQLDSELELGRHAELVPELEALVREHPLRERLRAQLMLALYRCGRQADALGVYRQGHRLLADELGLEPGADLRRLERAILEQHESLAAPERPVAALAPAPPRRRRRTWLLAAGAGAVLLVAALATGVVLDARGGAAVVVRANSAVALDARSGKVLADVPIGGSPVAMARGAGAVWVADGDHSTVTRIDERTKARVTIGGLGGDISDLAFGFGSLWVAGGNDGTLSRVDPATGGIRQVDLGIRSHQPVFAVRVGEHAVWLTRGNEVLRVDPQENRLSGRHAVANPAGIAAGLGALWVTTVSEHLVRFDATTLKPAFSHDLSLAAFFPVVARGALWVIVSPALNGGTPEIWRLDPLTLTQQAQIPLPRQYLFDLVAGSGALWTIGPSSGAVWRIDPGASRATRIAKLPHHPMAVVAGDGVVWVGVQASLPN